MHTKTQPHMAALVIGVPSMIWLYTLVGWKVMLALFLCAWANNLSQAGDWT